MPGYVPLGLCDGTLHFLSPIRQALAEYLFIHGIGLRWSKQSLLVEIWFGRNSRRCIYNRS